MNPFANGRGPSRWLVIPMLAAWALALTALGVWSAQQDPPTVRAQSELAAGVETLDRAVVLVVNEAGPGATTEVGDYRVTTGCRLTLARHGTAVERAVVVRVAEGRESALLDRLVERLPERWEARRLPLTGRLYADAGHFVRVDGDVAGPGEVEVTVATGCRPGDPPDAVSG